MLRFLSHNFIFTYIFLFVLAFALRAPSFHPNYFDQDESFYLVAAQKIADGGTQYVDTWDNKPPVIVWVYTLFVSLFGSFALLAIRIFTCLYLFISALLLNKMVVDNKLLRNFSLLPAFLFLVLCSVPWYTQELNGELLMNLPVILAVNQILRLQERSPRNSIYLFFCGIFLGLAFMIKYQAIFVFLGLLVAYFATQPAKLSETFSYMMGFMLSILSIVLVVYFRGALQEFWDIGVLYNLDYIRLGRNPGEEISILFNLRQYGQFWGVFTLLAIVGVAHFRLTYFTNSIQLRKVEAILLYWFMAALLTIILGGGRLYLHYFYFLVPPLVIYISTVSEFKVRPWMRHSTIFLAFLVPVFTYFVFLISAFPQQFSFVDSYLKKDGWVMGLREDLQEEHPLNSYIDREKINHGILVMDYEPTIYTRLNLRCATKYTNFSMANFKMEVFPDHNNIKLVSATETKTDIYQTFQSEMPDYIVDPLNLFPYLQDQIPLLFGDYKGVVVNEKRRSYKVYHR